MKRIGFSSDELAAQLADAAVVVLLTPCEVPDDMDALPEGVDTAVMVTAASNQDRAEIPKRVAARILRFVADEMEAQA